ncbi:hypothetical protein HanRHA438_Chr06g0269521 [Helianthus annuus]|nr:hypothetical protein HanRHA438_Chr06g0269521 [Helianthus annuus]
MKVRSREPPQMYFKIHRMGGVSLVLGNAAINIFLVVKVIKHHNFRHKTHSKPTNNIMKITKTQYPNPKSP